MRKIILLLQPKGLRIKRRKEEMQSIENLNFGEYIELLRKKAGKSLHQTAMAIGISTQFYSEVEKGHKGAFTTKRLEKLKSFFNMDNEEVINMYDKAAAAHKTKIVPQDVSEYILEHEYVISSLRTANEFDADEKDWQIFEDELHEKNREK